MSNSRLAANAPARPATKSGAGRLTPDRAARTGNPRSVITVERAADVLLHFAQVEGQTLGVTEIATDLAMPKAAVHRILSSLVSRGLVQLDPAIRRYALGPMAMTLGLSYLERLDIRRLALPELHRLSTETNETATLSVRTGDTRVYVDQVTPRREVIMSVSVGVPFPLHAGASSKAFLAFLPPKQITAYLKAPLARLTPNTITGQSALRRELREIRERGWARSSAERQPGAASAAAPVFDHLGLPVAVISVCGPAERFEAEIDLCAAQLLNVTRSLSARMGHRPDGQSGSGA